ncbi:MAG: PQQ-binding-like beta-propeller repeat protein [Planctomycetota bacterium]
MPMQQRWTLALMLAAGCALLASASALAGAGPKAQAQRILDATGVQGGLVIHLGCGDGALTTALRASDSYLVQGLAADPATVARARANVRKLGLYGPVTIARFDGKTLPYVEDLADLVVAEDLGDVPMAEVMRVLSPDGVAYVQRDGEWTKRVKPRPGNIDEWAHYLHDSTNNAVAHDTAIGPPRRLRWVGSPRWSRHHDRMASMSALVAANGRLFYIIDEGSRASIMLPSRWAVVARDAFNGTLLWKRRIPEWYPHLWPFKSGHAQLPRRLVAVDDRVYVTLGINAGLTALDAATGETVRTYDGTKITEEIIASDGVLFALVNDERNEPKAEFKPVHRNIGKAKARVAREWPWDEEPRAVTAVKAEAGEILWKASHPVVPLTLTADAEAVYLHDGQRIVRLDRRTGKEVWASEPVSRQSSIPTKYGCNLVAYDDVVLFAGGDRKMFGLSAKDGTILWQGEQHRGGHNSPEDLLVLDGVAYSGQIAGGRHSGVFTGYDVHTGEVKNQFKPDVQIYWFHHRCYRAKATDRYLLTSRTGIEFVNPRTQHWETHHWVRGGCLYGIMPANGLVYAPPHNCACYIIAKLYGLNALAPGPVPTAKNPPPRLERGPAYGETRGPQEAGGGNDDWPTYRHDAARSGSTQTSVPADLEQAWEAKLGGTLSSLVVAGGRVLVASVDAHTVHARDAGSGEEAWRFTAGGRVDSPPTVWQGRVLFGSADGHVYCLRATDGALAWRVRAAPDERRLVAWEQVESVWPVHGSVLVQSGVLYCVAGRSMFLDGGLRMLRIDPRTGRMLSETVLDEKDPATGENLQTYVRGLNMPTALPDVLSSDGQRVYMRAQPFDLDGQRTRVATPGNIRDQSGPGQHLFCGGGFLDGSWFHRIYWIYGKTVFSGAGGWPQAGRNAPAGRILCVNADGVYGYGRRPDYYKWSTPLVYHLFGAERQTDAKQSWVEVAKTDRQNPAGKPVTVEAWVRSEDGEGVVVGRGAGAHGYALYLKGGAPHFAVVVGSKRHDVGAKARIGRDWTHLAGVLTDDKQLQVYIDGKQVASGKAPGFIVEDPHQAMEIGADAGGNAGDYESPFGFKGAIDEVRIYHRALSPDELARHAAQPETIAKDRALVVRYPFDQGKAADASGKRNHGRAVGAETVDGRVGQALRFRGIREVSPQRRGRWTRVQYRWSESVPIHARAMVLAGKTLFIAGPPNLTDEEKLFDAYGDQAAADKLAAQAASLQGKKGATLLAVSVADGKTLGRHKLDIPPAWDALVAASGRLYLATMDGKVICLAGSE